jgi:hypothetical protein
LRARYGVSMRGNRGVGQVIPIYMYLSWRGGQAGSDQMADTVQVNL